MDEILRQWTRTNHQAIPLDESSQLKTILFADDQIVFITCSPII